jgi:serine/threonine protein phosphatase PrpC
MTDAPQLSFRSAGATHVGAVRKLNEDAFLEDAAAGLWVVADGVGGHDAGDYASGLVVAALSRIGRRSNAPELLLAVRAQLIAANEDLLAYAANEGVDVVASTVAVLLCFDQHYAAVWAGDSRIYRLRAGELVQLTRDHSAVQELVDAGALSASEARHHPRGNVITRAVGAAAEFKPELVYDRILPADRFLLCSDGLTKIMSDSEIAAALSGAALDAAPARLIGAVLEGGAPDNVTVVAVDCVAADG